MLEEIRVTSWVVSYDRVFSPICLQILRREREDEWKSNSNEVVTFYYTERGRGKKYRSHERNHGLSSGCSS